MGHPLKINADGRAYIRVSERVAKLITGDIDPSTWDDEELARGYMRDKNGKFNRPPVVVPRSIYAEWARRQMEQGFQDMLGDLREIVRAVCAIATDDTVDEGTRLRAADMIMNRVYGMPKQAVDVALREPEKYEQLLESVTIDRSLPPEDDDVVDAEVLDEDDWDVSLEAWDD